MTSPDNRFYEFESFLLDAGSRILLKDGATVRLTPKAFETLLALVQRAAQVVEKDQLIKEVWPDSFVEEGSLSRNIHELRKALGDDSSQPRYIETIPKRGYRFVAPVKTSQVDGRQTHLPLPEGETTVIEKHTFARVVSEEFDAADLSEPRTLLLPAAGATAERPAEAAAKHEKRGRRIVIIAAALSLVAIAVFALWFVFTHGRLVFISIKPGAAARAKKALVRLTYNSALDVAPAWSPDGTEIAFYSNRDGKTEIYVMNADGSKLAFQSNRDGNYEIYVMSLQ